MSLFPGETLTRLQKYVKDQGCLREWPYIGLCVACEFRDQCPVPRIPVFVWTARIAQLNGQAKAFSYLNDLAVSPIAEEPMTLPSGDHTQRETCVEAPCGLLLADPATGKADVDLFERLGGTACRRPVKLDYSQLRYLQFSYFGRLSIVAVQTCSQDCASTLSDLVNSRWRTTVDSIRNIRPPREID